MDDRLNPQIPLGLAKRLGEEKENAYTLYWDFVIDGTASMASLYPAVYLAVSKFVEWMKRYDVKPLLGITVIRSEKEEPAQIVSFENGAAYTEDTALFLKKVKYLSLYGGMENGEEMVKEALSISLNKFPESSLNRAIMVFTDCYQCRQDIPLKGKGVGAVTFFCPEKLAMQPFDFTFITPEGEVDEEGFASFLDIQSLFQELTGEYLDNIVKPLKDLIKGVSIGA